MGKSEGKVSSWFIQRFPFLRKMLRLAQTNINLELPRSHSERYKSKAFWLAYPFYYLGGIIVVLFIIECITGVLLSLYYVPSGLTLGEPGDPSLAYESVVFIMTQVPFGYILRGVHHWTAHLLIVSAGLHLIRVFFTSAYKKPRELNWILGVLLFLISILMGFTGYLLPWDQLGYWASTVGLEITKSIPVIGEVAAKIAFGGSSLSPTTVTRMYGFHWVLAAVGLLLSGLHIVVVWMQGIAEPH
jgi:quinol-cytochrome oxidoreductase complex cytochrome b subunit